jgi:YVTN family beta-propeller protein
MKSAVLTFLLLPFFLCAQPVQKPGKTGNRVLLPNGWSLSPAGRSLPLGDLPLNIAVSASKKWVAVTNNGQSTQTLQLIDIKNEKLLHDIVIPKSWYGLKFADHDQSLYASGGNDNRILKYSITPGYKLKLRDSLVLGPKWPYELSPAGFDIDETRQLMYVGTKENNGLYIVDLKSKKVLDSLYLGGEAYTCLLSPDRKELYISCWGCDKVMVYDTDKRKLVGEISVGDNPNELCLSKNGNWLYVANANDNSVSVIQVKQRRVVETLNTALYPDAPSGSTTNGVALSEDQKTLYIANADNNCLAVFDVAQPGQSHSKGFIPVGWYPTNVKVVGNKILVSNGKGFSSMANPYGPNPLGKTQSVWYREGDSLRPKKVQYIAGLFQGTLSIIDRPSEKQMAAYSAQVYSNTPYTKKKETWPEVEKNNPVPMQVGAKSPVKYVFYVVKENRTYDQVLGDIKEGNGDTSLVLFGEKITPNQHALAREFVLLDNFYVDAEVSADGHNWSLGGYATDYLEKTWPTSYGSRGGSYAAEGNRAIANNKNGFLWNFCKRAGVSFRTYGEFADDYKPNIPVLKDHTCPYFTGWNMKVRDTTRFYQWKREFDSLLAIGKVPQLNTLRFPNDHTEGLRAGRPSPFAHVADNDLAVGLFIEYLSKSPIWKESVVFIVEDDAQNGADHVDAHRSTAYIAGGMIKRNFVDHTMYSTTSMLRTIELILGLPPMSQYDAAATPMWRCFTNTPDLTPFRARPLNIDLHEKNTVFNEWQRRSEVFDLSREDAAPDVEFNIVLWHAVKGSVPFPGPRRAAFLKTVEEEEEE